MPKRRCSGRSDDHVLALHEDPARVGALESAKQPEGGGLAASARPEQREGPPPLEREREIEEAGVGW